MASITFTGVFYAAAIQWLAFHMAALRQTKNKEEFKAPETQSEKIETESKF